MTPQTPTFTAAQLRENAAYIRRHGYVDQADMLEFAADRLAHEEQTTAILGPIDETPCDTAERLRAEGRAEVYAEIAKLVENRPHGQKHLIPYGADCDWLECFFCGEDEYQPHKPDCLYLKVQQAVAAPDGVDR